jgi:hypothetical protein
MVQARHALTASGRWPDERPLWGRLCVIAAVQDVLAGVGPAAAGAARLMDSTRATHPTVMRSLMGPPSVCSLRLRPARGHGVGEAQHLLNQFVRPLPAWRPSP